MEYTKKFDYSNRVIKSGFVYYDEFDEVVTLDSIIDSVNKNIIIYDSDDYIIDDFLAAAQSILNNRNKLVIGLINPKTLDLLKPKGVYGGFFRATDVKANAAIIIVDKKTSYICWDAAHIYKTSLFDSDLYDYINHIIWAKTSFEFCQGRLSKVENTRLSVVKPNFKEVDRDTKYDLATKDFKANDLILFKEAKCDSDAYVFGVDCKSAYSYNGDLYVNPFENFYLAINDWKSIIRSESFKDLPLSKLYGRRIWVDGKNIIIKKQDSISKTFIKPADEYKNFQPDFEEIANEYTEYALCLDVVVNVNPMVLDSSYKLADNYKKLENLSNELSKRLEELSKLLDDKKAKKQIETIASEKIIKEKVNLYNKFIEDNEFGVDSLNNKKAFSKLKFEEDMLVPSDLIGKLYKKGKELYLALSKETRIDDAKKWLQENNVKAVLILENA